MEISKEKKERVVTCHRCGHVWVFHSNRDRAVCTRCGTTVTVFRRMREYPKHLKKRVEKVER